MNAWSPPLCRAAGSTVPADTAVGRRDRHRVPSRNSAPFGGEQEQFHVGNGAVGAVSCPDHHQSTTSEWHPPSLSLDDVVKPAAAVWCYTARWTCRRCTGRWTASCCQRVEKAGAGPLLKPWRWHCPLSVMSWVDMHQWLELSLCAPRELVCVATRTC